MRNKRLSALLLCIPLLCAAMLTARAESVNETYTVAQVESLCDGIVAYNGAYDEQDFIDTTLTQNAGSTAEFYAIALSQVGNYDFSRYEKALLGYLDSHEIYSASSREKYALALSAAGSTDRYITDTADEAIGGLGIMSLVFGLHILNNGYPSALYSTDGLVSELLAWQKSDGGWSVMGSYGDVDVTAMTLQALAPHRNRADVSTAVNRAVDYLSSKQLDDGGFKTMGVENCESAAQVVIALSALGIDAQADGRFIKNGCSAMNGMMHFYLRNGGFSHDGNGADQSAVTEAYCALAAYLRFCRGQGPLYVLDHAKPVAPARDQNNDTPHGDSDSNGKNKNSGTNNDNSKNGSQNSGNSSGKNGGSQNSGNKTNGVGNVSDSGNTAGNDHKTDSGGSSSSSGASTRGQTGGSAGSERDADDSVTDDGANRIVIDNGQRDSEATTASGEKAPAATDAAESTEKNKETQLQTTPSSPTAEKPTYGGLQPRATVVPSEAVMAPAAEEGGNGGYKLYAVIGVIIAGGIACAILFFLKKRGSKHYIAVGILTAAGVIFILLTNFQTAEEHRQKTHTNGEWTVTLTIRCDTIVDHASENAFIPENGVILDTTSYSVSEGNTVFDVLMAAVSENDIPMDNRGAAGAAYIAGINTLYEYDYGDLSGWMYRVNGDFPDVGCESYTVSDGDSIEWLYTTNIGKDLN